MPSLPTTSRASKVREFHPLFGRDPRQIVYQDLLTRGLTTTQAVLRLASAGMLIHRIAAVTDLSLTRVMQILAEKAS